MQENLCQGKDTVKDNIQKLMALYSKVISHLDQNIRESLLILMAHGTRAYSEMTNYGMGKEP